MFKKHKQNPSASSWETYSIKLNEVKLEAMSEFCREASSKSRHHGEFWSKLKPLFPNTKFCKPNSTVLIENNQIFTRSKEIAEVFNIYFTEVVDHVTDEPKGPMATYIDQPSIIAIKDRIPGQTFNFRPVEHDYLLISITAKWVTTGVGGISAALLKISAPKITQPVTRLINHFIWGQAWPTEWKSNDVIPAHKKDNETDKRNYQPISVITV